MTSTTSVRAALGGALVLLGIGLTLGLTGLFGALRPPAPQAVILALVTATVLYTTVGPARAWADTLSARQLLGMHSVRFVGVVFLILAARGQLSPLFAELAGWGDIAAAALALGLIATGAPTTAGRRRASWAWSVVGLADLTLAVGSATFVALSGATPGVEPLLHLPLVLVPTVAVPILVASHVSLFRRLAAGAG